MSTLISPLKPPPLHRGPGRIVERTTTITREVFLDDPTPAQHMPVHHTSDQGPPPVRETIDSAAARIRGFDGALIRLGVWLIGLGRAHALRPASRADGIASRLEAAKSRDMKHFIGLPH